MKRLAAVLFAVSLATPALAARMDDRTRDFVASNLLAIFYHEFGHALIDIMKLPIFGQEEDAADVLSAVLIHELYEEETAVRIAYATAYGFLGDANLRMQEGVDVAYWDVHGPDLQRYYTFVCLFYGANPDERNDIATELELPEPRQETCEEEFQLASDSWGPVIQELVDNGAGRSMRFLADHRVGIFGKFSADVIGEEVTTMNGDMSLPKRLLVRVEACGTVNAFYDPKSREIIMCTEFAEYLADIAPN
ncbi:MAG: DUF4344 domain-containing metallopeptidase [Rhodobacter sp.]|nr:DUF4344 domain-containing metallopeptidase [Rhodobacter sp.]